MMNHIYDNEQFFEAYSQMERSKGGLQAAGEWHQLQPMIPDLTGKKVLDLGCGYGWHCKYAADMGAVFVLGIDSSEKMIQKAVEKHSEETITYQVCNIEDYDYPDSMYDLVISNLVLHYIADLEAIYKKVYNTLKPGGCFLFNIEHPVFTAGVHQDWIYDESGKPLYWPVDHYFTPGERQTYFLGQNVKKQHHTMTQIVNLLLKTGFRLEALEEAMPPEHMMELPGMPDEMRRPMMLLVKAAKEEEKKVRKVDDKLFLIPYYPNEETALAWYQDLELCRQVDNIDHVYSLERLRAMYNYLDTHGDCYYIQYEGVLVGDVTLQENAELSIVVCKEYQNRHIGRKCIENMVALAKEKGIDKVKANIYSFNTQSQKMFQSLGFQKTGEETYERIIGKSGCK